MQRRKIMGLFSYRQPQKLRGVLFAAGVKRGDQRLILENMRVSKETSLVLYFCEATIKGRAYDFGPWRLVLLYDQGGFLDKAVAMDRCVFENVRVRLGFFSCKVILDKETRVVNQEGYGKEENTEGEQFMNYASESFLSTA